MISDRLLCSALFSMRRLTKQLSTNKCPLNGHKEMTMPVGRTVMGPRGRILNRKKLEARRREDDLTKERLLAVMLDEAYPELLPAASEYLDQDEVLSALAIEIESAGMLVTKGAEAVRKLSRKEHRKVVMSAYAYWIKSGSHQAYRTFVRHALDRRRAKNPKSKHNPKTTCLHLIVESLVSYGDNDDDTRSHSKLYSRDVQAIRWLNHSRIPPSGAIELAENKGEGLDIWAERWASLKKAELRKVEGSRSEMPDSKPLKPKVDLIPLAPRGMNEVVTAQPHGAPDEIASISHVKRGTTLIEPADLSEGLAEHSVDISWRYNQSGETRTLNLLLTERSKADILRHLKALEAIDLRFRSDPLGG